MARCAASKTAKAVVALTTMSLGELRAEWQRRYGDPPRHRSADLLRRMLG